MKKGWGLIAWMGVACLAQSGTAWSAWRTTEFTDVNIRMDNGETYFYPVTESGSLSYPLQGNCLYSRLSLSDAGDYFGKPGNASRIMALILTAKSTGKRRRATPKRKPSIPRAVVRSWPSCGAKRKSCLPVEVDMDL